VHLLTIGEAFDDVIFSGLTRLPRPGEELRVRTLTRHPGGGALLTAIAAARLGLSVTTISAVSSDNAARLRAEGVGVLNLRRSSESAAVSVALSTPRDRAFVTFTGVNERLEPRLLTAMRALRRRPRHVHFALSPRSCAKWLPVLTRLRRQAVTTSWDFGWNEALPFDAAFDRLLGAIDCVFVNELEATLYTRTKTMPRALARWRAVARGTVVKLGKKGAIALSPELDDVRQAAPRVAVVDTTGAGDAFNAGFLAAWLARASLDDALRLGNHLGAQSTRAAGGVEALPRRHQLPAWARRIVEAA
jgi:sugar/nucleoside kinase (ribokinase family)